MATVVVTSLQVIWETRRLAKNWQCNSCLFWGCQKYDNIELWNGQYCTCQMEGNQYCPWSILVSPPPAWLHSTRTRAPRAEGPRATLEIIGFGSPLDKASLYTRSPPQARAIKLRIALVLVEWSHAGGGETNIDLGQYWLLAARLACILQRTHQKLYSVPITADMQLLTTVAN